MSLTVKEPNSKKRTIILSVLSSLVVALIPCFYIFSRNLHLLNFNDLLQALGLVVLHWLALFLINLLFLRNANKAALVTILLTFPLSLFMYGVEQLKNVFPNLYYWHGVLLILGFYVIALLIIKARLKEETVSKINLIFGIVFVSLIFVNGTTAAFKHIKGQSTYKQINKTSTIQTYKQTDTEKEQANIYIFIFDEYSGREGLKRYTGYDNESFYKALTDLGFSISHTSRNYTINTRVELSNLFNLEVQGKSYTKKVKDEKLTNPYLLSLLRDLGYDFNIINDQNFFPTPEGYYKYSFTPQGTFQLDETLSIMLIDLSVYFPLRNPSKEKRMVEVYEMFDYAKKSSLLQKSNLTTIGYFMFPHQPWVVDEKGNQAAESDRSNWENPNAYLGQLKYSNKLILEMVEEILANDPNSCIILMSDHGYRQPSYLKSSIGKTYDDFNLEIRHMSNILNAVYYFGEPIDIEGKSGINTLRTILDKLFGMEFGLIKEQE